MLHYWKQDIELDDYLSLIFTNIGILDVFIMHFNIFSLKGHELIMCKYAKKKHYLWLKQHNICFDIQETLKYSIIYGKTKCFCDILTHHIKHIEQVNYIYQTSTSTRSTFTLMSLCAIRGYLKCIKELTARGGDCNIVTVNNKGEAMNNVMALVDNQLYNKEPNPNKLMIRICLIYLLKTNPVNWQNSRGQTALMMAYRSGNTDLAEILISNGADKDIIDMNSNTIANYIDMT